MRKNVFFLLIALLLAPSALLAADFDWMPHFNQVASANPDDFRLKISARFQINNAQVSAVLTNFPQPADAYVALRLGEMSGRPIDDVTNQYRKNRGRGWGVLAKSLGIKPGSREFHALKRGDDLYGREKGKKGKKNK